MRPAFSTPARLAVSTLLAVGLSGGVAATASTSASAQPVATVAAAPSALTARQGVAAVRIAASKRGAPYRWGATGPRAFDCSGLTTWTFKKVGKRIPRTAHQQYVASRKISKRSARPGDLVFNGGRYKTHVGIYAGRGKMWHAPRSGDVVKLSKVRANASYGRVR